jgi:acetyl esterase/lipase
VEQRSEPYASPLRASDEQLAGLPPAFVIVDEADVLRDEGEAYAARLRAGGVEVTTVRYDGITHDFMMLNPLSNTRATRSAVAQAISILTHCMAPEAGPQRAAPRWRRGAARATPDRRTDPSGGDRALNYTNSIPRTPR